MNNDSPVTGNTNNTEKSPLEAETERLRNHNRELLDELKSIKKKFSTEQEVTESLAQEKDSLSAQLKEEKMLRKLVPVLKEITVIENYETTMKLINVRGFHFDIDDNDEIVVLDAEGKRAEVFDKRDHDTGEAIMRHANCTYDDLKELLSESWLPEDERHPFSAVFWLTLRGKRASGSDASSSSSSHIAPSSITGKNNRENEPKGSFGLS